MRTCRTSGSAARRRSGRRRRQAPRRYTAADLVILLDGSVPNAVAAAVLGRTRKSVAHKRHNLERLLGLSPIVRAGRRLA